MAQQTTQSGADSWHLQERLARLEKLVADLQDKAGQVLQGTQLQWPSSQSYGLLWVKNTGGAISSGSSGVVTVYQDDGATLSADTFTAHLFLSGTWAINKNGYIAMIGSSYHVISADC